MKNDVLYSIALTQLDGVGYYNAKKIVDHFGSAKAFFNYPEKASIIPYLKKEVTQSSNLKKALKRAEDELQFIEKHSIECLLLSDENYPKNLKECPDAPIVLFTKGKSNFNETKIISVVGTRKITPYGKQLCESLIEQLPNDILVLSGLAYGVDIEAHKAAIKHGKTTAAVLAHGLDRIYPAAHSGYAKQMLEQGGALLSDFISNTNPDRENFPKRNRIVAGMAEATIVIESAEKGGSLITANLANSYSRDVFAFPGKTTDVNSKGCNALIKSQRAQLVESAEDVLNYLGWNTTEKEKQKQISIPVGLNAIEQKIYDYLLQHEKTNFDVLCSNLEIAPYELSPILLNMEFSGLISTFPGKNYAII